MGIQGKIYEDNDVKLKLLVIAALFKKIDKGITAEETYQAAERNFDIFADLLSDTFTDSTILGKVDFSLNDLKQISLFILDNLIIDNESNPYKILCISEGASLEEIKRRWKRLHQLFHPDISRLGLANDLKAKKINEAYHTILKEKQDAKLPFNNSNLDTSYSQRDTYNYSSRYNLSFSTVIPSVKSSSLLDIIKVFRHLGVPIIVITTFLLYGVLEAMTIVVAGILTLIFINLSLMSGLKEKQTLLIIPKPLLFSILTFIGFSLFQIIPLPVSVLKILSPLKYAQLEQLAPSGFYSISVYPYATMYAILKVVTYSLVFLMSVWIALNSARCLKVVSILFFFGFILSVFAISQKTSWTGNIHVAEEFGPLINREYFAGFIEMIIPFGFAFGLQCRENEKKFLYLFSLVIMIASLFYSLFLKDIASFLVALTFFSSVTIYKITKSKILFFINILAMLLVSCIAYFGMTFFMERAFSNEVMLNLQDAAGGVWLAGAGFGTSSLVSLTNLHQETTPFFIYSNNDYFRLFIEGGLLGSVIVMAIFIIILISILKSKWWQSKNFYLILACISSVITVAVHSAMEFNLHIVSNAIMVSVILGLLYGLLWKHTTSQR